MQFVPELYAEIDRAIEEAGMAGLCHDGRREFAIDKLITENSELDCGTIAAAVDIRLREMGENG